MRIAERRVVVYDFYTHMINGLPVGFFIFMVSVRTLLLNDALERIKKDSVRLQRERVLNTFSMELFLTTGSRVQRNEYVGFFVELLLVGVVNVLAIFVLAQPSSAVVYFVLLTMIVAYGFTSTHVDKERNVRVSLWLALSLFAIFFVYFLFLGSGILASTNIPDALVSLIPGGATFAVVFWISASRNLGLPTLARIEER